MCYTWYGVSSHSLRVFTVTPFTPWPLTVKTFSAMSTRVMNICAKFHWNTSTECRLQRYHNSGVTRNSVDGRPDGQLENTMPVGGGIKYKNSSSSTVTEDAHWKSNHWHFGRLFLNFVYKTWITSQCNLTMFLTAGQASPWRVYAFANNTRRRALYYTWLYVLYSTLLCFRLVQISVRLSVRFLLTVLTPITRVHSGVISMKLSSTNIHCLRRRWIAEKVFKVRGQRSVSQ